MPKESGKLKKPTQEAPKKEAKNPTDSGPSKKESSAYSRNMRLALSLPEMVTSDGEIRQEYFLTKKGGYWGENEDKKLKKGLKEFGFGNKGQIEAIKDKYKLEYFPVEIELRARHILGLAATESTEKMDKSLAKKIANL